MSALEEFKYTRVRPAESWRNRAARAWQSFRSSWTGPITSNSPEFAKWWGSTPTFAGVDVTEGTAIGIPALMRAVDILGGDVGSLPCHIFSKQNDGSRKRLDHIQAARVLDVQANPEMSAQVAREALQASALFFGNGYAEIERDGTDVIALWPITSDRVTTFRATNGAPLQYRVANAGGGETYFDAVDILHIRGLCCFDGVSGQSILSLARQSLGATIAVERFAAAFFGNGATFGGALSHPGTLTELARKNLRESTNQQHQGADRAHKFMVLEEGMKYEKFGVEPEHAQFLETRAFQVTEVARITGIPPHMLFEMGRATWGNSAEMSDYYFKSCLRRWLVRWEAEINVKFFGRAAGTVYAEFQPAAILRGNTLQRFEAYKLARDAGWLSVNDVRKLENLNPIGPEGDAYGAPAISGSTT